MTYSGRFTHISGHPLATGRARDRESTPAKDRYSTIVPRNQPQITEVWYRLQGAASFNLMVGSSFFLRVGVARVQGGCFPTLRGRRKITDVNYRFIYAYEMRWLLRYFSYCAVIMRFYSSTVLFA